MQNFYERVAELSGETCRALKEISEILKINGDTARLRLVENLILMHGKMVEEALLENDYPEDEVTQEID